MVLSGGEKMTMMTLAIVIESTSVMDREMDTMA